MRIEGQLIIEQMRACLTQMSEALKGLREEVAATEAERFPVNRNSLMVPLDMSLVAIHMLGSKLHEAQPGGVVELEDSERIIVGMSATFMEERVASLVEDALQGEPVPDERVQRELGVPTRH